MNHKLIVGLQIGFLVLVFTSLYIMYPSAEVSVSGNFVKFETENANIIMISKSPVFNGPRYIDLNKIGNLSISLEPGIYYWKPINNYIEGFKKEFVIESEVGLGIEKDKEGFNLVNLGNVRINVTKKDGITVGHVVLDPDESEEIEDKGEYIGREE